MKDSSDHQEMSFRSKQAFDEHGTLNAEELGALVEIAIRDGHIDPKEKQVLENVMARLEQEELDPELAESVEELKKILENF